MDLDLKKHRSLAFEQIDIYPVTCEGLSNNRPDEDILHGIIDGGAKIVQLRDKTSSKRRFYEKALRFRQITSNKNILLIINDHLDVALCVDADGIHLGQDDLPVDVARRLAPNLIIGASTHSVNEAKRAEALGADYVNIGPIFSTKTKSDVHHFLGSSAISSIARCIQIPFTVMGGINESNLQEVLSCGAKKVAMVTAITKAEDIDNTVKRIRQTIRSYHSLR